ncbi:FG-GAP-like repeat-containing protein [Calditrichota bacterium GD2]
MRRRQNFYFSWFNRTILSTGLSAFLLWGQTVTFSGKTVIDDNLEKAKKSAVADIDLDGDKDIVCTANPEGSSGIEDPNGLNVVLYLNDGSNVFSVKTIDANFRTARGLAVGDLNGDGYPDVAVGNANADSALAWYKNPAGAYDNPWKKYHPGSLAPFNYIVRILDFDGDSDLDIVDGMGDAAAGGSSADDYVRWLENNGADPPAFSEHLIINYPSPAGIAVADFNGDAVYDVAAMAWTDYFSASPLVDEDVRWWAQTSTNVFTQQEVIKTSYGGNDARAADLDGDGDADLIGAGYKAQTIDWWANDGSGQFGASLYTIRTAFNHARNVQAVDLDGDDDLDLLACADDDNLVVWFENDGSQNFTERTIDNAFTYAYFVTPADLNGDGDVDVVGTAQNAVESGNTIAGQLAWWENNQAEEQTIASGDPPPASFYSGAVRIDFQSGFTGGLTSVFFNHGSNANKNLVGGGVHHVAQKGFYTIRTLAATYDGSIEFSYDGIAEWSAISNEADLRICYWDENNDQWILAGTSQSVDALNNAITVSGIAGQLHNFARFTLGSVSSDNSLPVTLSSFKFSKQETGIWLTWKTESEIENLGFELWRSEDVDTVRRLVTSFEFEDALQGLGNSGVGKTYGYLDEDVLPGNTYYYTLIQVDYSGRRSEVGRLSAHFVPFGLTRVVNGQQPEAPQLLNNFPNPFNSGTTIVFELPALSTEAAQTVRLMIFDVRGRLVRALFDGSLSDGQYRIRWDGKNSGGQSVPSGKYICVLKGQNFSLSRFLTLVR